MSIRSIINCFLFTFLLAACNVTPERIDEEYFDFEGLISNQIQFLMDLNPELKKKALINGVLEEEKRKLDSSEWVSELKFFLDADINKPRLVGSYEKEIIHDENSKIVLFKAKDPDNVQVDYLRVTYRDGNLISIESLFSDTNILYDTRRNLKMNFIKNNQGETILSDYKINGIQKMILKDSLHYEIESEIIY